MKFWTPHLDFWVSCTSYLQKIPWKKFIIYHHYLNFFILLVLTHRYGRDGRDSKKFEDKSLVFDFCFLQRIAEKSFINNYKSALNSFVNLLNENPKTGKLPILYLSSLFALLLIKYIKISLIMYVAFQFLKESHINPTFLTLNPIQYAQ